MQTLRLYIYDQPINLQLCEGNSLTLENRNVYTKPIVLFKGINNTLKLLVKNEDQKAISISGTLYVDIVHAVDQRLVATLTATNTSTLGLAELVIPSGLLVDCELGYYTLLIRRDYGDEENPLYGDDNYGVAVPAQLKQGYDVLMLSQSLDMGYVVDPTWSEYTLGSVTDLVDETGDFGSVADVPKTAAPPQVTGPNLTPPNQMLDEFTR